VARKLAETTALPKRACENKSKPVMRNVNGGIKGLIARTKKEDARIRGSAISVHSSRQTARRLSPAAAHSI
jgi:hypothetical protein